MTLVVEDLDVFYGQVQALRAVSLRVGEGERVALLGANGAGKTTTLRTVSGLMAPRAGEVTFEGESIAGLPAWEVIRRGIAHLPEGRDLFAELSVMDNLKMGHWTSRRDRRALRVRLETVMGYFPILAERSSQAAGTLSGGEQQMLGVARSLMSAPKLLVIDELSLGLAPKIVQKIFDILGSINAEGTAVLLVEQFAHMALEGTDRAYVLSKGEVVLDGPSDQLAADPALIASYLGGGEEAESPAKARRPARRTAATAGRRRR